HLQYYSLKTLKRQLALAGLEATRSLAIDWSEPGAGRLSRVLYKVAHAQAALVHFLSRGRLCTNIGLSVLARAGG
ncbi:MAG: hypothetical protein V1918_02945, partial [Planctomycetota bacterium]